MRDDSHDQTRPVDGASVTDVALGRGAVWEGVVFWLMAAASLAPIWTVGYFPSNDGPEHLHNAFVLLRLNAPGFEVFKHYYQINPAVSPNWAGHVVLAALMSFLPALMAEKILVSAYLISFAAAARYALGAVRREGRYLAVLAFPLAYNWFFHMGFYNFCFSLAVFLVAVGFYFRSIGLADAPAIPLRRMSWGRTFALSGILLGLYFCHVSAVVMAMGVIGGMAVWTSWRRPTEVLRVAAAFLPLAVLVLLFLHQSKFAVDTSPVLSIRERVRYWAIFMASFSRGEAMLSVVLVATIGGLVLGGFVGTLKGKALGNVWLGLGLMVPGLAAAGLIAPQNVGGGGFVFQRLVFFTVLIAFLYAGHVSVPMWVRRVILCGGIFLSVAVWHYYSLRYREVAKYLEEYTSVEPLIENGSTVMPVSYQENVLTPSGQNLSYTTDPFRHAAGYLGRARPIVDLDNYEGVVGYFPIIWRPEVHHEQLKDLDILNYGGRSDGQGQVDYVYTWNGGAKELDGRAQAVEKQLQAGYELIKVTEGAGYGRLWKRKPG